MFHGTVSYCPEDDKIRLYVGRVPRDEYERLRAAGFVSTPKQDCDFVAVWTPDREDIAREYLDDDEDIGDEDYSPEERAADKSERFEGYRDKRATEACASADAFESGPTAFGHQNQRRAERQAFRHDRKRVYAVSQWSKAEYWHARTASVIAHALHKSSASVRRGRILTLEAEQRKLLSSIQAHADEYARWQKVLTLPGADQPVVRAAEGFYGIDKDQTQPAPRFAYALANRCHGDSFQHPRSERTASLYSLMTDEHDPITATEAATLWLAEAREPGDPQSRSARWAKHLELRLQYENAMLENEGGMAGEAEMEVGGWICTSKRTGSVFTDVASGWKQIHGLNRSPATKRVTSVKVMGLVGYRDPKPGLVSVSVERLGENCYRPPTDEERAAFAAATKERKAAAKANKGDTIPLVNPTNADAQRLQDLWNAKAAEIHAKAKQEGRTYGQFTPTEVRYVTQAVYSANSKGEHSKYETVEVCEHGHRPRRWDGNVSAKNPPIAFKVRKCWGSGGFSHQPDSVVVITDKPQKPLPLDWDTIEGKVQPVAVTVPSGPTTQKQLALV